jgi:uncharacterized protein (DUF362 family)/NAD-dependent dihydropyrimidine dehydrogenase PreA subunit
MNTKVAARRCREYDTQEVQSLISEIYKTCDGPDVANKKVLLKPNILIDCDPSRCVSTHPVVVEAMIRFMQERGAVVFVGDSPSIHIRGFKSVKSGIYQVCQKTGATWVDFLKNPAEATLTKGKIKIASIINEVDLIISLPKFKNHELVYFTGAVKNTLGLVPGFTKAKQHAIHQDRDRFAAFLVDLAESVTQHFYLMDGIMGMEGPGPGQGIPIRMELLIGSSNPVALDIIATTIAGYDPMIIPTNAIAISRETWLKDPGDIIYDGPDIASVTKKDFRRIPTSGGRKSLRRFIINRLNKIRRIQRRPVFIHENCIGCRECIKMCPRNAIVMHPVKKNWVVLTDKKCIRCFCCSEVCQSNAVEIRRKPFGA